MDRKPRTKHKRLSCFSWIEVMTWAYPMDPNKQHRLYSL
jgi:hypothetical protein